MATISSTLRTESPSATIRWASRSIAAPSSRPSRARACPAERTPAASRRATSGGSRSSRMVLEICGRDRPMRVASSSCEHPKSSSSCWYAAASSSGFSWLRCRFSRSASRSRSSSCGLLDDRRDRVLAGQLAGPQPALAHDELEPRPGRFGCSWCSLASWGPSGSDAGMGRTTTAAGRRSRGSRRPARPARPRRRRCAADAGSGGSARWGGSRRSHPGTGASVRPGVDVAL